MPNRTAVLLLAHGSPDSTADIPEFLKYVTGGRPVPEAAVEEIRRRYSLIGKSPLTEITLAQGEALQRELGLPVYVGMRNWRPFIGEVVHQVIDAGVEQFLAICLAPQHSSTSVGLYKRALFAEMKPEISVNFVEEWHDHPLLVKAFAEKLEPAWHKAGEEMGTPAPVIFTAHSVPMRTTGFWKTPGGISGSIARRRRNTKATHKSAEAASRPRIGGEDQG